MISRLNTNATDNEILYAVCIIDDIFELGSEETV